jgi:hypothetical protein
LKKGPDPFISGIAENVEGIITALYSGYKEIPNPDPNYQRKK